MIFIVKEIILILLGYFYYHNRFCPTNLQGKSTMKNLLEVSNWLHTDTEKKNEEACKKFLQEAYKFINQKNHTCFVTL